MPIQYVHQYRVIGRPGGELFRTDSIAAAKERRERHRRYRPRTYYAIQYRYRRYGDKAWSVWFDLPKGY